jgi:hypothetical protein
MVQENFLLIGLEHHMETNLGSKPLYEHQSNFPLQQNPTGRGSEFIGKQDY